MNYLNSLSKSELYRFGQFLDSPYLNTVQILRRVFSYVASCHPGITADDYSYSSLKAVLSKDSKLTQEKYRKLISDFNKAFEDFLVLREFENDSRFSQLFLLKSLRHRGERKRFEMTYSKLVKSFDQEFTKDADHYLMRAYAEGERFRLDYGMLKHTYSEFLEKQSDCIDNFFLFEKLHLFHQMSYAVQPGAGSYSRNFYNEVIRSVEKRESHYMKNHPNIYVIYLTLRMRVEDDVKIFEKLRNYVTKNMRRIPADKLAYYFNYLTSFSAGKVNDGDTMHRKILLDLYRSMDSRNLFLIEGFISDSDYSNVINVAIAERELEFAEAFADKYKESIDSVLRKDAYNLSMAKLLAARKKYDKMFIYLNQVDFVFPHYYMNAKFLLARTHFDRNDLLAAQYVVDNMRQYMRANKGLDKELVSGMKAFTHYMVRLIKLSELPQKEKIKAFKVLYMEIESERRHIPSRNWFMEKMS